MCGILGVMSAIPGGLTNISLASGLAAMRYRGPDASGEWGEKDIRLGHVRLSILDLSPAGAQPMLTPSGRYVISFNGEIYNFPSIRDELERLGEHFSGHSDTEVLLRAFERFGSEACLQRLNGMFAFAIYDRQEESLFLARDRLGVKPLVYAESAGRFTFASEISALLAVSSDIDRRPDYLALDHYLAYQYIPAPMTAFASIRKLPPGHCAWVKRGRIQRIQHWWSVPAESDKSNMTYADACEQVRSLVLDATRVRMISDVPLGAFLSGGIDSSIVVAAMARQSAAPIKTFSIGFEDDRFNELPYAKEVASHLGTDHHELIVKADCAAIIPKLVRHFGEPHADSSALPTYAVSEFTRRHVTVALTGDGGDEPFAGYRRFYHASTMNRMERHGLLGAWRMARRLTASLENGVRRAKGRPIQPFPASRADQALFMREAERYKHLLAYFTDAERMVIFRQASRDEQSTQIFRDLLAKAANLDPVNRYLFVDLQTYLPDDVLAKVDICSMANSLECRSPLLDYRLIEFAMGLPGNFKLGFPHRHKSLLKDAFAGWLPNGFLERKKMGFSAPVGRWLKNELAPMLRERLCSGGELDAWVDRQTVEKMVEMHIAGEGSFTKQLWSLLILAEWKTAFGISD